MPPTTRRSLYGRIVGSFLGSMALIFVLVACSSSDSVTEPDPSTTTAAARVVATPSTESTTTTTTTIPLPTEVVIDVLGSIRDVSSAADGAGVATAFSPVLGFDDATIASLGCAESTGCDSEALVSLVANDIDIVNLATAAASVDGVEALGETAGALVSSGVATVGYGETLDDAATPALVEVDDEVVAFYAISLSTDLASELVATETTPGILAGVDALDVLGEKFAEAGDQNTVLFIDWGQLDARAPTDDELEQTELVVSSLAPDVIVGHGSDFLLRFERIADTSVSFGLGNAVTTTSEPLRADTAILEIRFEEADILSCLYPAVGGPNGVVMDDPTATGC